MATGTIVISIANLKPTNTSGRAHNHKKKIRLWLIWDIVESVHGKL
jgi:hypothetical protein